jgi:methylmalonyl-CoA mutase cobalamin-binding domain/chain
MTIVVSLMESLRVRGAGDVVVLGGGTSPTDDLEAGAAADVAGVSAPGASVDGIVELARSAMNKRHGLQGARPA